MVSSFVASSIRNQHDVEDVVQQVAIAVAQNFHKFDPDKSFVRWTLGIAHKCVQRYHRTQGNDRHIFDSETLKSLAAATERSNIYPQSMREALHECFSRITDRAALLLEMRYFQDMKPRHIAKHVGMTTNAVCVMLHRTRNVLEECIKRRLAEEEAGR